MRTTWPRMTTKRTKKRKYEIVLQFFRHPLPSFDRLNNMRSMITLLALVWTAGAISVPIAAASSQKQTNSHAHDFVIFATVFSEQGFALPGARVRVRRADEQKFRWEAMSDRRGELGIRVKQGAEYELIIEARGFKPQTRKIDAREGDREDLTLQMEQLAGGKP
jgi:hypothetical protein